MYKLIAFSCIAALTTAQIALLSLPQAIFNQNFLQDTPHITFLRNFKADLEFYTQDENHNLVPNENNMTAVEYIDQERNFERLDVTMVIPNLGYGLIQEYIDLNNQVLTVYIPSINSCEKYALTYTFQFKDLFDEIEDPTKGFITYLGLQTLEWDSTTKDHAFLMSSPEPDLSYTNQILYFSEDSLKIEWSKMVSQNMVIKTPSGQIPATFTDADFALPSACDGLPINPLPQTFKRSFMI